MNELPQDPIMLLSVINTKLRDQYPTLDALCSDIGIDAADICRRLAEAGFEYMPQINQFR